MVGRHGFEPWKSKLNRFTVCPLWPLGYLPENINLKADERDRTFDLLITNQLLYQLSYIGIKEQSTKNVL